MTRHPYLEGPRGARFATVALVAALVALLGLAPRAAAAPGDIATVAGAGTPGFSGDTGPAVSAQLEQPHGVAPTPDGGYLIADSVNHRIRKVSPGGVITTVAGNGVQGFSGDTGPATSAQLNFPTGVAPTPDGGFLIADYMNQRIRKVSAGGTITTVAGDGSQGFSGDSGPATSAQLRFPYHVAPTADGGFLIADTSNHRIRKVSAGGTITTLVGNGINNSSGDGGPATAAEINAPTSVAPTADGGFLIAEITGHRIRKVTPGGTITTVAGTGAAGSGGDGGPATAAQLNQPVSVAVTADGGFLISETGGHRIRIVAPNGTINTFAGIGTPGFSGDGGPATSAELNGPQAVAEAADGSVVFADTQNHRIRRVERTAATPSVGTLIPQGCIRDFLGGDASCQQSEHALNLSRDVAVSPDGASAYALSQSYDAIVRFNRNTSTGALTPQGCIDDLTGPDTCGGSTEGLDGAYGLAISPDGASVYVASLIDDAIVRFDRDLGTGALTPAGCVRDDDTGPGTCGTASAGLDGVQSVAVTPDGDSVYAVSSLDNALVRFDRAGSGALTPQGCFEDLDSGPDACGQTAEGLTGGTSVSASPDDLSVYTSASTDDAVTRFDRTPGTGALTSQGCVSDVDNGDAGCATQVSDLGQPNSITVSSDGTSVYASALSSGAVTHFSRSVSGALTRQGCIVDDDIGVSSCTQSMPGLGGAAGVEVSADGKSVYVAAFSDDSVAEIVRNTSTGALTPHLCTDEAEAGQGPDTCPQVTDGLDGAFGVAVAPDSTSVYVATTNDDTVVAFRRVAAPDVDPPETTIDSGPSGLTNDATVDFTFSSDEPGSTFECSLDQGTPSFSPCTSPHTVIVVGDGAYTFRVRATDPAANADPSPATRNFTLDTSPPDTTLDSGPSGLINDPTPTFTFSSATDPGATFQCSVDTGTPSYAPCSGAGTHTPSTPLADGSYTFRVRAVDAATNVDPTPATRAFTVDATPPDTSLDSGPSGLIDDPAPTFTFSSADPGATFECSVDTGTPNFGPCSGTGSHTPSPPLADGSYTFRVRAIDTVNNADQTPAARSFTVDTDDPVTSLDSGPSGPTNDPTPTFTFSSGDPGATFECSVDTGTPSFVPCSGTGTHTPSPTLADGDYTFRVRAVDGANNFDPTPETRNFTVDTNPPPTSLDSGAGGPTNDQTPTFTFSSVDPGATFQCSIDTGTPNYAPCSGAGTHTPAPPLTDGTYTFRVRAVDAATNADQTPATSSFTVDTDPPDTVVDSGPSGTTADTTPTFTFSADEAASAFQCSIDTGTPSFGPCSGAGTHTPASALADGSWVFRVQATDSAGNPEAAPATRAFSVNTATPPPAPVNGDSVVAGPEAGVVKIKVPGSGRYVILRDGDEIPVGTRVDASQGRVNITSISPTGVRQSADFYAGRFQVLQPDGATIVTLKLEGGNFSRCPRLRSQGRGRGKAFAPQRVLRRLWGSGRGRFRTRGRGGAGTVRGTRWLTADRCDGTLFKVREGIVAVRDFGRNKSVDVKAGGRYLARLR